MYTRPRIDREDEIAFLNQFASGEIVERLLLISAETGMGKSVLLRDFKSLCSKDIRVSLIDFKIAGITLNRTDLIYYICEDLGWKYFPNLDNLLKDLLELPNIQISKNALIGAQNRISILINRFDKSIRSIYIQQLTKAFFDDLRNFKRVVLILDTFENAHPRLRNWILSVFLQYAKSLPELAIIVSGQEIIEPPADWMNLCYSLRLGGIDAVHWFAYAQTLGIPLDLNWFEGCCFAINGHPLRMAQILTIYIKQVSNR